MAEKSIAKWARIRRDEQDSVTGSRQRQKANPCVMRLAVVAND